MDLSRVFGAFEAFEQSSPVLAVLFGWVFGGFMFTWKKVRFDGVELA